MRQAKFQFHSSAADQLKITNGFKKMSGAGFHHVIGAIDGLLIWMVKPKRSECEEVKCGEKHFKCSRKDKFGLNLQAICDHRLRFLLINVNCPGLSSDYMAWITSELCQSLESQYC